MTTVLDDPLEPLGIAVGAFLVLAALGTIAGAPWTTLGSLGTAVVRVLGALLMAGVGVGLIYLVRTTGE
jgi:hypothetical protein